MAEKKAEKKVEKKETRGQKSRRLIDEMKKLKDLPVIKMPVKKKPAPKKESWVSRLKKKVRSVFASEAKEKKPAATTARTRAIQKQLAKAGVKVKTDQERAAEKRKKQGSK